MTSEQIQVPRLTNEEETQIITRNFFYTIHIGKT